MTRGSKTQWLAGTGCRQLHSLRRSHSSSVTWSARSNLSSFLLEEAGLTGTSRTLLTAPVLPSPLSHAGLSFSPALHIPLAFLTDSRKGTFPLPSLQNSSLGLVRSLQCCVELVCCQVAGPQHVSMALGSMLFVVHFAVQVCQVNLPLGAKLQNFKADLNFFFSCYKQKEPRGTTGQREF